MDERDGLRGNVVPHRPLQLHLAVVSMQSTGVYWIAVYDILEAGGHAAQPWAPLTSSMESSGVYWKPVWNILERTSKMCLGARPIRRMLNCEDK